MHLTAFQRFHFIAYLTFLSILGFLATDMYLPAFDIMHLDLGTSKGQIGASLALFLGGYALAQLLWGPVSDRFGISKAVLWGLIIFVISSLGLFWVQNITVFIAFRTAQAVGACAAAVCWQALVVQNFSQTETKKVFATIMPLVALSPALAPLVGAYITNAIGWRYIFVLLSGIAFALILYTFRVPNSSMQKKLSKKNISYRAFLKSSGFIGNVLIYGACSAGFFAWLTGVPFFLKELGYNEQEIGLSFVPQTIAFIFGGYGYRFVSHRIHSDKALKYLLLLYSISMLSLFYLGFFTRPTLTILLIPFCLMAFANGATYPIVVAEALKPYINNSGRASALLNFLQLSACFIASAVVSGFAGWSSLKITVVVMISTVVFALMGFWISRKRMFGCGSV